MVEVAAAVMQIPLGLLELAILRPQAQVRAMTVEQVTRPQTLVVVGVVHLLLVKMRL